MNLNLFSGKEDQVSVNYAKQNSTTLGMLIIIAIVAIKEEKKGNDNVGVA